MDQDLTDWERRILATPFGALPECDVIDGSWLSEAVTVLAWSLGKIELPAFDEQCDPADVANTLGFLQPTAETALNSSDLRLTAALDDYNEFIYNLHWRLRDFSLHKRSYDCSHLLGDHVLQYGLKRQDKDLCIAGVPISRADEAVWHSVLSLTRERHRASNWLVGYDSEDFYEVATDT